jgi:hypothetical protein
MRWWPHSDEDTRTDAAKEVALTECCEYVVEHETARTPAAAAASSSGADTVTVSPVEPRGPTCEIPRCAE